MPKKITDELNCKKNKMSFDLAGNKRVQVDASTFFTSDIRGINKGMTKH
jgi:hypothetical protein